MIDSVLPVLPVQQNLPPQKSSQREVQQKDELSPFANAMNEKQSEDTTGVEKRKAQQEEQKEQEAVPKISKLPKVEGDSARKEELGHKELEAVLLSVSDQIVALEQLRVQPELLYQYIQKLQEMYQSYGNIKMSELPQHEIEALQSFLGKLNIEKAICLEDTLEVMLNKVETLQKLLQFQGIVQTEMHSLMKNSNSYHAEDVQGEVSSAYGKEGLDEIDELLKEKIHQMPLIDDITGEVDEGIAPLDSQVKGSFIDNLQSLKSDKTMQSETASLPELGKKLEAKIDMLQRFVVKQERVLFQLNPEKLGALTVYMRKQGDQIQVHVEMDKHDVKKSIEIVLDELKLRLKEKEIHIELSYSDKNEKREEQERQQSQKKKQDVMKHEQKQEQDFAGLLEE
ncbi:hypothetical protein BAMA_14615 [Bacillus manliponensis]|uniref:Flagellar hook-length control protein-like C-terminal domain-containing protein n=2 Tax=Bacillus manliponensis TaxID=574376 RepID=A0A073K2A9_9BACI|nr:flagellar hook-length control protein FliK [Bacillus manliponensis]KEK20640.1 hypothetical protein BAMA_14615 [Bacillus manliponensis]